MQIITKCIPSWGTISQQRCMWESNNDSFNNNTYKTDLTPVLENNCLNIFFTTQWIVQMQYGRTNESNTVSGLGEENYLNLAFNNRY